MSGPTAVVIGGGISGLSALYYLQKNATNKFGRIILFEASNRLGGWINSQRLQDGAVFEQGPRSLRPVGKPGRNTLLLLEELNIENEILPVLRSSAAAKNRYLYVNKKLSALPSSLSGVFKRQDPFTRPLIWQFFGELFKRKTDLEDETIHDFMSRRISKEFADIAVDSMCRGIFAGDSRSLSMKSCFPEIYNLEKKYGSFILGGIRAPKLSPEELAPKLIQRASAEKWASFSFKTGMEQLPMSLIDVCQDNKIVDICLTSPVKSLRQLPNNKVSVRTDQEEIHADHVFSAVYSKDLAKMLDNDSRHLKTHLDAITASSCAVINIEYEGHVLPVQGFGHLSPSSENKTVFGIIYDSCSFPYHDRRDLTTTRITVVLGGTGSEDLCPRGNWISDDDLITIAKTAANEQLGISVQPIRTHVSTLNNCIPQYKLGHSNILNQLDSYLCECKMPLHLIGSSYRGVSVNDCILNAKLAVENIV